MNKVLIFNRIKLYYNLKSDIELSRFLDIPPTTLSSWKSRNTIDYDLILEKCGKKIFYYVVTGDEEHIETSFTDKNGVNLLQKAIEKKDAFIEYIRDENDKLRIELKKLKSGK